ncbi:MAG: carbon storage regulator CsrA [Melioribacteraceae bacterium]|nr:carbon storage regulator CsrA [Melioribacteraceae bacterium]MCF8355165.1 carbon storage regulator CsrA [Melioribacteraceae bacterium]MCF8392494.1 carbon storage regulator CsrA [Melioribacteraceae bacterium]MCF8418405.1 carbon storage regulator CsrA [Melioribacteraceae bacterium]
MLVLSRKIKEKIRIDSDIIIEILSISDGQVKIGIEAPKARKIYREEIYMDIKESTIDATKRSENKPAEDLKKYSINKLKK